MNINVNDKNKLIIDSHLGDSLILIIDNVKVNKLIQPKRTQPT